jgi:hypothetical protein
MISRTPAQGSRIENEPAVDRRGRAEAFGVPRRGTKGWSMIARAAAPLQDVGRGPMAGQAKLKEGNVTAATYQRVMAVALMYRRRVTARLAAKLQVLHRTRRRAYASFVRANGAG